jgi:hypothetical protein
MVSIGYNAVSTTTPAVPPAITPSAKNLKNTHTHILYEKKKEKKEDMIAHN